MTSKILGRVAQTLFPKAERTRALICAALQKREISQEAARVSLGLGGGIELCTFVKLNDRHLLRVEPEGEDLRLYSLSESLWPWRAQSGHRFKFAAVPTEVNAVAAALAEAHAASTALLEKCSAASPNLGLDLRR